MRNAFLLTRGWRDTHQGLELELWWSTDHGPLQTRHTAQEAVFFIPESRAAQARQHLAGINGWRLNTVALQTRECKKVVALYFRKMALAREAEKRLTSHAIPCWEADIRPPERFLMERFITAAAQVYTDTPHASVLINPPLAPAQYRPSLRLASVDIETSMDAAQLYSIGVWSEHTQCVFIVASYNTEHVLRAGVRVILCASETECLRAFLGWLQAEDPDGLIGWNLIQFDLWVLHTIAQRLNFNLNLARGSARMHWREEKGEGGRKFVSVPGRVMLDGIDLLKAANYQFETFGLDFVAGQLLGEGKLLHGAGRGEDITRLFQQDKLELARYNIKDCELVWDIFKQKDLLAFAIARSQLTGLLLDRVGGSVAAFEYSYLPRLHREGYVAPNLGELRTDVISPGGYVMDSAPGLYDHVLVLDFKSLYPSIIRTFFIDPCAYWSTQHKEFKRKASVPGFNGAEFDRNRAILPGMIETLWQARDKAKQEDDQPLSYAIKIIMNSFYGVLGSNGCRFFDPRVASSITLRGHEIIQRSKQWIEAQNYKVIYGDTDSVFVWLAVDDVPLTDKQAKAIGQTLAAGLNQWWQETLQRELNLDSALEIEFETHYRKFLMPTIRGSDEGSKKRYAGMISQPSGNTIVFKGLESVRSDWTALAREFQTQLYENVFLNRPYRELVLTTCQKLMTGEVDKLLTYRKRLRRRLDDYEKNVPPHVQAARKLRDWTGETIRRGDWIHYVITTQGAEPVKARRSPIDYDHYRERQLAPVADAILYFFDDSMSAITDQQMSLFG
ncbi:DNA polymerase II [Gilvimarinus sp. SDUM040013]|uniref:DNA polymerase n=1 Tax=Gilvimarinus gilvus TaxID=3058038 RepID=A0ABU4RUH7_9GAMM|nr:DNA polymerase II [Gilvimarinus sp. SDUM040013]MDO3388306.1 DNA polymerase II [Gilvimarinus sp. SDUM040013]MDX6847856.1 DNA polymerase II [Gilvimarinus sp. SDUM040013]